MGAFCTPLRAAQLEEASIPAMSELKPFDLGAYLERIGDSGPIAATGEVLDRIHQAHATTIPFENLDILLGRPIRLDLESLQAKLVRDRRGGYCFEQNTLFAAALQCIGFRVTTLAARVRYGATRLLPRTHMLLKVDLDDGPRLADVGFGGDGLLKSVPLEAGRESRQFLWSYRVIAEGDVLVLQALGPDGWFDLYSFTLEPHFPVDYEMGNYYTSTYPTSIFRQVVVAQRPTPEGRHVLRGRDLSVDRGSDVTRRELADDEDVLSVLSSTFGLEFPAGTRFRSVAPPGPLADARGSAELASDGGAAGDELVDHIPVLGQGLAPRSPSFRTRSRRARSVYRPAFSRIHSDTTAASPRVSPKTTMRSGCSR